MTVSLVVDGVAVEVDDSGSLLDVLRETLGIAAVKDGCSPQGQCGCCTVLVDGAPRVACVTPARRVADREIMTLRGLEPEVRARWGEAFCATGGSQCGFCTPGIVLRLEGLRRKARPAGDRQVDDRIAVDRALAAHLCRCTGWQTIREAYAAMIDDGWQPSGRDEAAAAARAALEGRTEQGVAPAVALGEGGFADDAAPDDALVAVADDAGGWAVGDTLAEARERAGRVQGRRTTLAAAPPLQLPDGDWDLTLRTSWVEPAYLETDSVVVRPRRRTRVAPRERRGLRREGRLRGHHRRSSPRRRARPRRPRAVPAGGRRATGREAATHRGGCPG